MKESLFTLLVLLCFAGNATEPDDDELLKELEQRERQRLIDQARHGDGMVRTAAYYHFARSIRIGDSSAQVSQKLSPPWIPVDKNNFISQGFFPEWIPWTNHALVAEWRSEPCDSGWPEIVFGLFSDVRKTNLVDALIYTGGQLVEPLVDGPYNRKVLEIKAGDTMEMVFRELGRKDCEYFNEEMEYGA